MNMKFKCELLTDVILNQSAATEGPNKTLDFIPGSCFLGILAQAYGTEHAEWDADANELFFSGKVRFGDAHPAVRTVGGLSNMRSLHVPASMYHPKMKKASECCYIHHRTSKEAWKDGQPKQCRKGFYDFSTENARPAVIDTAFAIKSAYDADLRTSKDEQMYGYESLRKGLVLYFSIDTDDDTPDETNTWISDRLTDGVKRIGRSRSAQYGLVQITPCEFKEINNGTSEAGDDYITVYADGRLIFLDENHLPTTTPTVEQLLGDGSSGKIDWEKSQVRTFRYSPYNGKRHCFDATRLGIEKGSVFVIKKNDNEEWKTDRRLVGSYRNEGFGKVIYNPDFLACDSNGSAKYRLQEKPSDKKNPKNLEEYAKETDSVLIKYLCGRKREEDNEQKIYDKCKKWKEENGKFFDGEQFASQWGNIRQIAMTCSSAEDIEKQIFKEFLEKGKAKEKWSERGKKEKLHDFFKALNKEPFDDTDVKHALINLAAMMAKECRKGNHNE